MSRNQSLGSAHKAPKRQPGHGFEGIPIRTKRNKVDGTGAGATSNSPKTLEDYYKVAISLETNINDEAKTALKDFITEAVVKV